MPKTDYANALPYRVSKSKYLHDIILGDNGDCHGSYLCDALGGYDGPTGLGTPRGISSF